MSEFYKHIHGSALPMPALAELSTGQPSDWEAEGESKWGFLNEPRVDVEASQTAMIHCRGESSGAERGGESKGRGQMTLPSAPTGHALGPKRWRASPRLPAKGWSRGVPKAGCHAGFCCFVGLISLSNTPFNIRLRV